MREPIEELFKKSLRGHEMPYNPDAWNAMNARLDAVSPVLAPRSYLKYYFGAAAIGAVALLTYFFVTAGNGTVENSTPLAKETTKESDVNQANTSSKTLSTAQSSNSAEITKQSETVSAKEEVENSNHTATNSNHNTNGAPHTNKANENPPVNTDPTSVISVVNPNDHKTDPLYNETINTPFRSKLTMPSIEDMCLNEERTLTNTSGREIYILDALNTIVKIIPANKTVIFKPAKVGNYGIAFKNDSKMETTSNFQVNRIPDAEFAMDMVKKFENGLPTTHVEAISGQGSYIWKTDKQLANGLEADLHFYKKGEHTIALTVDNGQCASTLEKSIYIENDYNLLAMTAFTPSSSDARNNTFMPFALTQRDVRFRLTIIDSRDGGIVYETTDATLPWDGTDIRTGRLGAAPQVFVWKAIIFSPAQNEPNEYLGTILMN